MYEEQASLREFEGMYQSKYCSLDQRMYCLPKRHRTIENLIYSHCTTTNSSIHPSFPFPQLDSQQKIIHVPHSIPLLFFNSRSTSLLRSMSESAVLGTGVDLIMLIRWGINWHSNTLGDRQFWHCGIVALENVRLSFTGINTFLVTVTTGIFGVGNNQSKTESDAYSRGIPLKSYLAYFSLRKTRQKNPLDLIHC